MKCAKYLPAIRSFRGQVQKAASKGERVLGSLIPNRSYGWGGWGQEQRFEQVQHYKNWTYVAVNLIGSKIASIFPNLAFVVDQPRKGVTTKACRRGGMSFGQDPFISDGGHSFLTMGAYRSKALSVVKPHEELEPLEADHPLRRLEENPNPMDTAFDIAYEAQMFSELCGVDYEWLVPNDWGMPAERWVIPSHWVWPRTGGGSPRGQQLARLEHHEYDRGQEVGDFARYRNPYVDPHGAHADEMIQYYEVRPWGGMGSAGILRIPPNEIIMTRWKSPLDKINGYSKLAAIAQWIDSEESISKSRWAQFMNQARPEFWVELGAGYEDPDDDKVARIEAKFMTKFQGELNYGKPIITPPGAKVTPLSFNPTEMAYYQCHDAETECLTAEGWKKHAELTKETRIACYDPESKTLIYRPPSSIFVEEYKGPMHRWEGQRVDALMTPNHRVHVERATTFQEGGEIVYKKTPYRNSFRTSKCRAGGKIVNEKVWCVKRVEELAPRSTYGILSAAPAACDQPEAITIDRFSGWRQRDVEEPGVIPPETWLRFLGYYVSEGCISRRSDPAYKDGREIDVSQKKHLEAFREGIEATPFRWKSSVAANGVTHWKTADKGLIEHLSRHCGTNSFDMHLPDYVKAWPASHLKILLDALIMGDGASPRTTLVGRGKAKNHEVGWGSQYYTSSVQLADDVQEIAVKCGLTASISEKIDQREEYAGRVRYTVNIASRTTLDVTPENRSVVNYEGTVWCVTVPTGLFVVRRNGKAHISGNSEEQIRDMILSTFAVPKTAVGVSNDMTFGAILATLGALCVYCLNPRLAMRGQARTKHLASRWSEPGRRCKLWWDDCVPADPAQVNSDLAADMQCILPGQELQGQVIGGSKARYSGDAIEITARSGAVLLVTPNHPVLTEEGFVPAGLLEECQYLLRYVGNDRLLAEDDIEYAPAPVEDVFDTLCRSFQETRGEMAGSPVDFHGDAVGFKGQIQVVGTYGKLRNGRVSEPQHDVGEGGFIGFGLLQGPLGTSGMASLVRCRELASASGGPSDQQAGSMLLGELATCQSSGDLGSGKFLSTVGAQLFPPLPADRFPVLASDAPLMSLGDASTSILGASPLQLGCFRVTTEGDACFLELPQQPDVSDAEISGKFLDGLAGSVVGCDLSHVGHGLGSQSICFGPGSELDIPRAKGSCQGMAAATALAGQLCDRFPGQIATDEVVKVRKFHYEGSVYDFESPYGYIIIEGIVVSNSYAVTPNEVRALRGRRSYALGGDNPMVQGPGGIMPLPINVEEDMGDLGKLIGEFSQAAAPKENEPTEGQAGSPEDMADGVEGVQQPGPGEEGQEGADDRAGGDEAPAAEMPENDLGPPKIDEPNGKPSKQHKSLPQGTTLTAKVDMKIGRLSIKTGQRFWVTNSQVSQQSSGNIVIDREGKGSASNGVALSESDVNQYFSKSLTLTNTPRDKQLADIVATSKSLEEVLQRSAKVIGFDLDRARAEQKMLEPVKGDDDQEFPEHWFTKDTPEPAHEVGSAPVELPEGKADPIKVHLPDVRQSVNFSCGASALLSICEFFGVGPETEQEFIDLLPSDPDNGTDPPKILRVAKQLGLETRVYENMTLDLLRANVDAGNPVLVLVQAWYDDPDQANFARDEDGHYVVAIGHGDGRVYFEDPSLKETRGDMADAEFLERWHDEGADGKKYVRWGVAFYRPTYSEPIKAAKSKAAKARDDKGRFIKAQEARATLADDFQQQLEAAIRGGSGE